MKPKIYIDGEHGTTGLQIRQRLAKRDDLDIKGADIVEVTPAYDHADITAIAGAAMAQHYLGLLAEKGTISSNV